MASDLPPLVFAGDAFYRPRVEGAVLPGLAVVHKLIATRDGKDNKTPLNMRLNHNVERGFSFILIISKVTWLGIY